MSLPQDQAKTVHLRRKIDEALAKARDDVDYTNFIPPYYVCAQDPKITDHKNIYCNGPFDSLKVAECFLREKEEFVYASRQPEKITIENFSFTDIFKRKYLPFVYDYNYWFDSHW